MRIRHMLLATVMAATPLAAGFAQSTGPDTKAGSTKESTSVKDGAGMSNYQAGSRPATSSSVPTNNGAMTAGGSGTTGTAASGAGGGGAGGGGSGK